MIEYLRQRQTIANPFATGHTLPDLSPPFFPKDPKPHLEKETIQLPDTTKSNFPNPGRSVWDTILNLMQCNWLAIVIAKEVEAIEQDPMHNQPGTASATPIPTNGRISCSVPEFPQNVVLYAPP